MAAWQPTVDVLLAVTGDQLRLATVRPGHIPEGAKAAGHWIPRFVGNAGGETDSRRSPPPDHVSEVISATGSG